VFVLHDAELRQIGTTRHSAAYRARESCGGGFAVRFNSITNEQYLQADPA
jgi:autonomous glycyl radical cofactor GrcA